MKKFLVVLAAFFLIIACSKNDDGTPTQEQEEDEIAFNREAMLINWADNIIVPGYEELESSTTALTWVVTDFIDEPTESNLFALRLQWMDTYRSFQKVSLFEIGKAEEVRFRDRMNTYPTNATEIQGLIANGTYDFSLPSTNDAQGFPALDYLLNGLGEDDSEIVSFYQGANGVAYKNYLESVSSSIKALTTQVLDDWKNGFRDDFVANSSSSASASVDKLTNDYVFYYEKSLRAGKVGIPAGVFSNNPLPGNVEGFYSETFSRTLALDALNAAEGFFRGRAHNCINCYDESFETYLDYLNTIKNGEDLSDLIIAQFEVSKNKMLELQPSFIEQIEMNNSAMLQTYDELQRNVILLKVDMMQALSINIDYVDADGD